MLNRKWLVYFLGLIGLLAFASVPALATLTIINTNSSEPNLLGDWDSGTENGILDRIWGLQNLQRIDDFWDQIWYETNGYIRAAVKFAGHSHDFGYYLGTSGTNYNNLFTVEPITPGNNWELKASSAGVFLTGGGSSTFRFVLYDTSSGSKWSSLMSDNNCNRDHMVTWKIMGNTDNDDNDGYNQAANVIGNYVIAWEDLDIGDQDYNDVVLEVHGAAPVPEPGTLLLLGSGVAGLAGYGKLSKLRFRRRKK